MLTEWTRVRHFGPAEWGIWERVDPLLIYTVDALREEIGGAIVLGDALVAVGHARSEEGGQHPRGTAVDCHAVSLPLLDFWLAAERFPDFLEIGIYPFWRHPGLHLATGNHRGAARRARWWRDQEGRYQAVTARALYALMERQSFTA